jgi:hypothetical protein
MYAATGANPEAAAITEVILGAADKPAQTGPVRMGHGEMGGEKALTGLVEGLVVWNQSWHEANAVCRRCRPSRTHSLSDHTPASRASSRLFVMLLFLRLYLRVDDLRLYQLVKAISSHISIQMPCNKVAA